MIKKAIIITVCAVVIVLSSSVIGVTVYNAVKNESTAPVSEAVQSTEQETIGGGSVSGSLSTGNASLDTSSAQSTVSDVPSATQSDFDMFEDMLNETAWVWSLNDSLNSESISLSELIENFVMLEAVPQGVYTYFWSLPDNYYENPYTKTNSDGTQALYYTLDADNVDWVIQNVFGKTPNRNESSSKYFYEGNNLYREMDLGGGLDYVYEVEDVFEREGYGDFVFTVSSHEDISNWSKDNARTLTFICSLKNDSKLGNFWAIKEYKTEDYSSYDGDDNTTITEFSPESDSGIYDAYAKEFDKATKELAEKYEGEAGLDYYPSYMIYDMDKNGVEELIIRMGNCEANFSFEFYTYDGGIKYIGSQPGGHSGLAAPADGNGLYLLNTYFGISCMYRLTLDDDKISKEVVFENEEYTYFDNYDFTYLEEYHKGDLSGLSKLKS